MSRISNKPLFFSNQINIYFSLNKIYVLNSNGILFISRCFFLKVYIYDMFIFIKLSFFTNKNKVFLGTFYSLFRNIIFGITYGYEKKLNLIGVGYKVKFINNNQLFFLLGFSHPVLYNLPMNIKCKVLSPTEIIIYGISKHQVGQVSSDIRNLKFPEPYKGKGIRYDKEIIIIKEKKKTIVMNKKNARINRIRKLRIKVKLSRLCRLVVSKTNTHIYARIIDCNSNILFVVSSVSKIIRNLLISVINNRYCNKDDIINFYICKVIGVVIAQKSIINGIRKVVFDRSGHKYHGNIKILAIFARKMGLFF